MMAFSSSGQAGLHVDLEAALAEDLAARGLNSSEIRTLGMAVRPSSRGRSRPRPYCRAMGLRRFRPPPFPISRIARPSRARAAAPRCRKARPSRRPRGAGPAARRGSGDVVGDAFLLQQGDDALGGAAWASASSAGTRDRRSSGRSRCRSGSAGVGGEEVDPVASATQSATAARLASARRSAPAGRRSLRPSEAVERVLDASIEGVLMVSPLKMPSISLPPLVRRKSFGSGQAGV
jgi:hypothetical protein